MKKLKSILKYTLLVAIAMSLTFCNKDDDLRVSPFENLSSQVSSFVSFNGTGGIVVDSQDNIFAVSRNKIMKITPSGDISLFAGDSNNTSGNTDGIGSNARFNEPQQLAIDNNDNIYVVDYKNNRIRKIMPNGEVTTLAGSSLGYKEGKGSQAKFNRPFGIAVDENGVVYVADTYNFRIRKIMPNGEVTTLAGNGIQGYKDQEGTLAEFDECTSMTIGIDGNIYVSDALNQRIRKITPAGLVSTFTGNGNCEVVNGKGTDATVCGMWSIATDKKGNLIYVDLVHNLVRIISPDAWVATLAGSEKGYEDGDSKMAKFDYLVGIAINSKNEIFVIDYFNSQIRKIIF